MKVKLKLNYKVIFKEIVIVSLMLFVISNAISYFRKPKLASDMLYSFIASTIFNKEIDTKTFLGEPILVHLWATWCPTCRMENSNIETISKSHKVITIVVNSGSNESVQKYMNDNNFTFEVINDNEGILAKNFNIKAFPTTFIYDADGKLQFTEVGYTTTLGLLTRLKVAK